MDSSSRKIVTIIAIIAFTVMAVIVGKAYVDSVSEPNIEAVVPATEALSDGDKAKAADEAANNESAKAESEFSTDVPVPEEIPAINGEPSMILPSSNPNENNPPASAAADSTGE